MKANKIKDQSSDRKYWVGVPQIVWAKAKDPYEVTLWLVIKMIAGEDGECYLSTPDLAAAAMMSAGKASQCRRSLIESGLLEGEVRKDPGYPQPVWHLTIPDLWPENVAWRQENQGLKDRIEAKREQKSLHQMKGEEPSPGEGGLSPGEGGLSPGETKKNHIEEPKGNPHGAGAPPPATPPPEPVGEELITEYFGPPPERLPAAETSHYSQQMSEPWTRWGSESEEMQRQLDRFGERGRTIQRIGYELERLFGMRPLWNDRAAVKSWMSGISTDLQEAGGDEKLIPQAAQELRDADLDIATPYSLRKKVASLAAKVRSPGGNNGKPAPYTTEWYKAKMENDPQYQTFAGSPND